MDQSKIIVSRQSDITAKHENHAEYIYSESFIVQKISYIHDNPVRSGLVNHAEDYLYSSARNYAGLDAVMEIDKVDLKWKTV